MPSWPRCPDFIAKGLPLDSALGVKLWRVSRILGCSPWASEVLDLNLAQLDWILQMQAKDYPGTLQLTRGGKLLEDNSGRAWVHERVSWAGFLRGKALGEAQGDDKMAAVRAGIAKVYAAKGIRRGMVGGLAPSITKGPLG